MRNFSRILIVTAVAAPTATTVSAASLAPATSFAWVYSVANGTLQYSNDQSSTGNANASLINLPQTTSWGTSHIDVNTRPVLSVQSFSDNKSPDDNNGFHAYSSLTYKLEIVAPRQDTILISAIYSLSTNCEAYCVATFDGHDDRSGQYIFQAAPQSYVGSQLDVQLPIYLETNVIYSISLTASASETGSAQAEASFTFDSSTLPDAQLYLSPGIGNSAPVPEPASWVLLLSGCAAGSLFRPRRSR